VIQVEDAQCDRPQGGAKTVGIPQYLLAVMNSPEPPAPPTPPPPPLPPVAPPGQVVEISPGSGAANLNPVNTTFCWTGSEGATSFVVWLDGMFQGQVFGTCFTFALLDESTSYSLRVDALGEGGATAGTELVFTTGVYPAPQVVNLAPADGDLSVNPAAVVLTWMAGSGLGLATSYSVYLNGALVSTQVGTSYNLGALADATLFSWRVDAINSLGATPGDTWSFGTPASSTPPLKATTPTPADGLTTVDPQAASLTWADGGGATSYDVWVNGVFQGNQAGTSFNPGVLIALTGYTWRIDSKNAGGTTTGDTWSFTTTAHATVLNWASRVVTNGGAAPSTATKQALHVFCVGLDSASLTAKMKAVCCFAPDNLIASITPLIKVAGNDPWTNVGPFAAGDLTVNGLIGNASSKRLTTGVTPSTALASVNDAGLTLYVSSVTNGTYRDTGFYASDNLHTFALSVSYSGNVALAIGKDTLQVGVASPGAGYYSGNRDSNTSLKLYYAKAASAHAQLGATQAGDNTGGALAGSVVPLFCLLANVTYANYTQNRVSFAAYHTSLSLSDSGNLFPLVQALRTALGGGHV
jgi:hypothetical protein